MTLIDGFSEASDSLAVSFQASKGAGFFCKIQAYVTPRDRSSFIPAAFLLSKSG